MARAVLFGLMLLGGTLLLACSDSKEQTTQPESGVAQPESASPTPDAARDATSLLEQAVHDAAGSAGCTGAVLVAERGAVLYKAGIGQADAVTGTPNSPTTRFLIGSLTKQFTSMLVLQLVEQGRLQLDAPVTRYLPDYPAVNSETITLHHLLTHTSGIPNYTALPSFARVNSGSGETVHRPEEIVGLFVDLPLRFQPGTRFEYSNSNYVLAGLILERVTGETYTRLLDANILTPLGMQNTGYDPTAIQSAVLANGYRRGLYRLVEASHANLSAAYAAGGIYSTVEDLFIWERALAANRLLSPELTNLLFTAYTAVPPAPPAIPAGTAYGYGWIIGPYGGSPRGDLRAVYHNGAIDGFTSVLVRFPDEDRSIVVLCNVSDANPLRIADAIVVVLYE